VQVEVVLVDERPCASASQSGSRIRDGIRWIVMSLDVSCFTVELTPICGRVLILLTDGNLLSDPALINCAQASNRW